MIKMAEESYSYDLELQVALSLAREAGAAILEFYEGPLEITQLADTFRGFLAASNETDGGSAPPPASAVAPGPSTT